MHLTQNLFQASKRRLDVTSHFVLSIGALGYFDVEVKAALPLLVQVSAPTKH